MKAKPERVKVPVVYTPHSESICTDCGARGCWIPTPHKGAIVITDVQPIRPSVEMTAFGACADQYVVGE